MTRDADPRRPLALALNPEGSVEDASETSRKVIVERIGALSTIEQVAELRMLTQIVYETTNDLINHPLLGPEEQAAVGGLVRTIDQRVNWLAADQLVN